MKIALLGWLDPGHPISFAHSQVVHSVQMFNLIWCSLDKLMTSPHRHLRQLAWLAKTTPNSPNAKKKVLSWAGIDHFKSMIRGIKIYFPQKYTSFRDKNNISWKCDLKIGSKKQNPFEKQFRRRDRISSWCTCPRCGAWTRRRWREETWPGQALDHWKKIEFINDIVR